MRVSSSLAGRGEIEARMAELELQPPGGAQRGKDEVTRLKKKKTLTGPVFNFEEGVRLSRVSNNDWRCLEDQRASRGNVAVGVLGEGEGRSR